MAAQEPARISDVELRHLIEEAVDRAVAAILKGEGRMGELGPAVEARIKGREGVAAGEMREIIGAVDETFLQRMMLVFIDLVSGYLLFEEVAEQRGSSQGAQLEVYTLHSPLDALQQR